VNGGSAMARAEVVRRSLCSVAVVVAALASGCAPGPRAHVEKLRREWEELRAEREREMAGMAGERPAAGRAEPAPAEMPSEGSSQPLPDALMRKRPAPDWVADGKSAEYPSDRFLTGLGSCQRVEGKDYESMRMAEERARDSLARSIRVRVTSEYRTEARLITDLRQEEPRVDEASSAIVDRITSRADLVLDGVAIADRWYDAGERAYWALAVLDRRAAGENILDRILQARREAARDAALAERFRSEGRLLPALAHYNRACGATLAALGYRAQLRFLAPDMADRPEATFDEESVRRLWEAADLLRRGIRVGVLIFREPAGGADERLAPVFTALLRRLGLQAEPVPDPPAGASYSGLLNEGVGRLRAAAGADANALLLARIRTRQSATAAIGNSVFTFFQGRGDAVLFDLGEKTSVADTSLDYMPETHTGDGDPKRAEERAVWKTAQLVADSLEKELGRALNVP